jgi:hypothetical protein
VEVASESEIYAAFVTLIPTADALVIGDDVFSPAGASSSWRWPHVSAFPAI